MVCRFLSSLFETFHFLEKYYIFFYRSHHHDDGDDGRKQWYGGIELRYCHTIPPPPTGGAMSVSMEMMRKSRKKYSSLEKDANPLNKRKIEI